MQDLWRLEMVTRLGGQVKSLEELAELRGASKMLKTMETLPIHVQNKLDELVEESRREKEKETMNGRRRSTI